MERKTVLAYFMEFNDGWKKIINILKLRKVEVKENNMEALKSRKRQIFS